MIARVWLILPISVFLVLCGTTSVVAQDQKAALCEVYSSKRIVFTGESPFFDDAVLLPCEGFDENREVMIRQLALALQNGFSVQLKHLLSDTVRATFSDDPGYLGETDAAFWDRFVELTYSIEVQSDYSLVAYLSSLPKAIVDKYGIQRENCYPAGVFCQIGPEKQVEVAIYSAALLLADFQPDYELIAEALYQGE